MISNDEAIHMFYDYYGQQGEDVQVFNTPSRINLFGDYLSKNRGSTLSLSLNLGVTSVVRWRKDAQVNLRSDRFSPPCSMNHSYYINYDFKLGWANVPRSIMRYWEESGGELSGADIIFSSDIPKSAGMGATAAIKIATAYMFNSNKPFITENERMKFIDIARQADAEFLGVESNVLNLMTVCLGKNKNAIMIDTHNMDYRLIPACFDKYQLVLINSNKNIDNMDEKIRERMNECQEVLNYIRKFREIDNLSELTLEDVDKIEDEYTKKRANYIVREQERVFLGTKKVISNDIVGLGKLLIESHISLRDEFEVSGNELDALVEESCRINGCVGAKLVGWGFGGCAIALVKKENYANFRSQLEVAYKSRVGYKPDFYPTDIADGVKRIR